MNEEYENKTNGNEEEKTSESESYYSKYTESANFGTEPQYAYKTVMDGVPRSRGWSVASMVLGILSILCCCLTYGGLIMAVLAIIFAIVSRRNLGYFDGMAIAGLVTGIIGLVFGAMTVMGEMYLSANPEFLEEYLKQLESFESEFGGTTSYT